MNAVFVVALAYIFGYGGYGAVLPFLPIILRQHGFIDSQIGLILAGFGVAAAIAPLVLSHCTDRHPEPRKVLARIFMVAGILCPFWLWTDGVAASFLVAALYFGSLVSVLNSLDSYALRFLFCSRFRGMER